MLKNMKKYPKSFGLVLALIFGLTAGVAYADFAAPGYNALRGATAPALTTAHTAASAAELTTWTTPLNAVKTGGNQNVAVYALMGTASATCTIQCGLYFKNDDASYTFLGFSTAAITVTGAASGTTDGGKYPATALATFDTRGAPYYDIRIAAISTGTATLRQWTYGAMSAGP